ncbi:MAG: TetR/AcrR family transcriptional regulator C-terminal domain-containing protein [Candidatus Microsaccharimonas sp.]
MARRPINRNTPAVDRDTIVQAALLVLNRDGLANLTIRSVADVVGVRASALYWHVRDKTALVDYMAEAILQTEFATITVRTKPQTWQDWLILTMQKLRTAMLSHRDGGRVVTGAHLFPAISLTGLIEAGLFSLSTDGVELAKADTILTTAIHFTFGRVIEEQSGPTMDEITKIDFKTAFEAYPLLYQSIQRVNITNAADEFKESLELIVNGAGFTK